MAWITMFIVALAVFAGHIISEKTSKIDSPLEQTIEYVLEQHGVDIDFSAEKKQNKTKQQKNCKNQQNDAIDKK